MPVLINSGTGGNSLLCVFMVIRDKAVKMRMEGEVKFRYRYWVDSKKNGIYLMIFASYWQG